MIHSDEGTFEGVLARAARELKAAPVVEQDRWQGTDVRKNPAAEVHEVRNFCLEVDLGGIEDLEHWRREIGPNLPWADDHFAERVGGHVLNPGEEWKNWPWGKSADRFRADLPEEFGPRLPPQDWAYLAGIVDGDGSIYYKKKSMPSFQGRVYVSQKNPDVLHYLHSLFQVGNVVPSAGRKQVLNGKQYDNTMYEWQVTRTKDVRWILSGCLPYFQVKRKRAIEMLAAVETALSTPKLKTAPLLDVWGKKWPARFNHSYPDRLWPKRLEAGTEMKGHHSTYGDLQDLVELLTREPSTRQAWIPLFFPEDTGWGDGGRKPCTLGYQFLVRSGRIHIWYPLRSCDYAHHMRDDCYLAVRLLLWVLDRCRGLDDKWKGVVPGTYAMHITSLHIFVNDWRRL